MDRSGSKQADVFHDRMIAHRWLGPSVRYRSIRAQAIARRHRERTHRGASGVSSYATAEHRSLQGHAVRVLRARGSTSSSESARGSVLDARLRYWHSHARRLANTRSSLCKNTVYPSRIDVNAADASPHRQVLGGRARAGFAALAVLRQHARRASPTSFDDASRSGLSTRSGTSEIAPG